jgi:hypothetical protein
MAEPVAHLGMSARATIERSIPDGIVPLGDSPALHIGRVGRRWPAHLQSALVIVILAVAIGSITLAVLTIGIDLQKSYNEGWNAYHAARVAAGEPLYSGDLHRLVNYPFLSFVLVAWLKPLFGNVLIIGRALNLLALAAVAVCSALIVRRLGGRAVHMLFAAACVVGFQEIQAADWIGTDEPQMLAEAFMLAGLLCYLSGSRTASRLAAVALLLATGGFIKHTVIAIPLAVTIDILWHDRRAFAVWCLWLGAAFALYVGATYALAGGDFFHELLAPRVYHWSRVGYHAKKFLIAFKIPILVVLAYLYVARDRATLLRAYGVIAFAAAMIFSGGDGVSYNIFLDVAVFAGIVAALALRHWSDRLASLPAVTILFAVLPAIIAQPVLTKSPQTLGPLLRYRDTMARYAAQQAAFEEAKAVIRDQQGTVVCENLLLCFEAARPLVVDPFSTQSMILSGQLSEAGLIRDIAEHRFAAIELPVRIFDGHRPGQISAYLRNQGRFTEGTLRAIDKLYRAVTINGAMVLYLPR